jgi:hypothetical protein
MTITREYTAQASVTDFTEGGARASGVIKIFNEEASPQRFIEETRFETPTGLIFKLPKGESIVVPAARNGVPGSIEATVYAEEAGPEYNLAETDFVIPGWRESNNPKFDTQYARSVSSMSGGSDGTTPVVSEASLQQARQNARESLRELMIAQAVVDAPDNFIFFEDGVHVVYSEPVVTMRANDQLNADVTVTGTMALLLFDREQIARFLAEQLDEIPDNQDFTVMNPSDIELEFSRNGREVLMNLAGGNSVDEPLEEIADMSERSFRMRLRGVVKLQGRIDHELVHGHLAGEKIKDVDALFEEIPEIRRAEITMRPFWRRTIPHEEKRMIVSTNEKDA